MLGEWWQGFIWQLNQWRKVESVNPVQGVDIEKHGLLGAVRVIQKKRALLIIFLLVGFLVGVVLSLTTPKVFKASASFISASQMEMGSNPMVSLSSAASRFGLDVGGRGSDLSPLFPWILESRFLETRLLLSSFDDGKGDSLVLLDVLVPAEDDSLRRIEAGLELLHTKVMRHRFDLKSGVTTLSVILENPFIAKGVANSYVAFLDEFNQHARTKQAQGQVNFLTTRLQEIEKEFLASEKSLMDFRTKNRRLQGSPQLKLEETRLVRELELNQELYISLKTHLEVTRLEAIKDLPLIVMIDQAYAPTKAFAPRPLRLIATSGVLGFVLGLIFIFLWNQVVVMRSRMVQTGAGLDP